MFEDLSLKIESALKKVRGQGRLSEKNISDTLRDIRRVLLDADVNYKVAKEFIDKVSEKALGQEVISSITPGQLITKIIYDELVSLLGSAQTEIKLNPSGVTTIMVVGLQGSGKTTFCAKLARRLKEHKRKVLLAAADVYRPAAIEQLKQLGDKVEVKVFSLDQPDARKTATDALNFAKQNNFDTLIIDTAGRLHIDEQMMSEISDIKKLINPSEILFVVDSMTGQDAVNSAKAFNETVDFDGIVLTKLDGDARGGAALSIRSVVGKPIKFISNGEKTDALDVFYPDRLASRILGKGDVISLVEKAQQSFDEKEQLHVELGDLARGQARLSRPALEIGHRLVQAVGTVQGGHERVRIDSERFERDNGSAVARIEDVALALLVRQPTVGGEDARGLPVSHRELLVGA